MCYCSDEYPEFANTAVVKARKPHRCEECGEIIPIGERYERTAGKFEGQMFTTCVCVGCAAWGHAFAQVTRLVCGCSGWILGEMWNGIAEFAREHLGFDPDWEEGDEPFEGQLDPKLGGPPAPHAGFVTMETRADLA